MRLLIGIAICLMLPAYRLDAAVVTFSTSQSPFDFGGYNQGWWSNSVSATDSNSNYIVGWGTYRNFFTFDLRSLGANDTIASATLKLRRGDSGSTDGTETIGLFDVTTSASALNHNSGFNSAIYTDLGSGTSYGSFVVSSSGSANDVLSFSLNAAAIAALNASKGHFFSIGGALLTDDGNDYIFGATGGHLSPHDLVLDIQPTQESVPEPATFALWGSGIIAATMGIMRRRLMKSAERKHAKTGALTFLVGLCLCSPTAFGAVGVTITSGTLATYADDFNGSAGGFSDAAGFGMDGVVRNAFDGGVGSGASFADTFVRYHWTNAGSQAVFEANASDLNVVRGAHYAYSIQHFFFTLTERVQFSLEGMIEGSTRQAGDTSLLHVYLYNHTTNTTVGEEIDNREGLVTFPVGHPGSNPFNQRIDGVRQGNRTYFTQGILSGELDPGTYEFFGQIQLQRDNAASEVSSSATGFTRLTLTDPTPNAEVPEPATLLIWSVGAAGCAIVGFRRRKSA